MIHSVSEMIKTETDTSLFLVDIGVWAFRELLKEYADRVLNIGVFEDGMISLAAGMAMEGIIPTVYGISPFIVGRAFEQLKLDFAYQELQGNFITIGASYDFSTLGYSHYCPEDMGLIKMIPGFEFVSPGSPEEFESLFAFTHRNGKPTYYRMSDYSNQHTEKVCFGKANVLKVGSKAVVIAVGTMLDAVLEACGEEDVTILYYTTLEPFDSDTLIRYYNTGKVLLCEPDFKGALSYDIIESFDKRSIELKNVGVPREILRNYGTKVENDMYCELCAKDIRQELLILLEQ